MLVSLAKAVVPWPRFVETYGDLSDAAITAKLQEMAPTFLRETQPSGGDRRKESAVREVMPVAPTKEPAKIS